MIKLFEEFINLKSVDILNNIKKDLASAAQKVYDDWEQDENGYSHEYATGGICQDIASEMLSVLFDNGVEDCTTVSNTIGDQHVWVVAKFEEGVYSIDISPYLYEEGGGYDWKKIPDVTFTEDDIEVYFITPDPDEFENYLMENNIWGSGENKDYDGKYIDNQKDTHYYVNYSVYDLDEIYSEFEEISLEEFLKYVSEETIKNMFPIYKTAPFKISKDWAMKAFKRDDELALVRSGYDYIFKKKHLKNLNESTIYFEYNKEIPESMIPFLKSLDMKPVKEKIGYHVSPSYKDDEIIKYGIMNKEKTVYKFGKKTTMPIRNYFWLDLKYAEWFKEFKESGEDYKPMSIWKVNLKEYPLIGDSETEDMSEWDSRFEKGENGTGVYITENIPPNRIIEKIK